MTTTRVTRRDSSRPSIASGRSEDIEGRGGRNDTNAAVQILKSGGVVVFPTETSYGLAVDATNKKAVGRVFQIKGRTGDKSLPLIAANRFMVEKYAILSPAMKKLVKKYWPGPLTVIVPVRKNSKLSRGVIRDRTLAVRVSSHPFARELSSRLGRPIVSTSANLSGQSACYSVRAVKKQLSGRKIQPDFYLDGGKLPRRRPSKIIIEKGGEIVILR